MLPIYLDKEKLSVENLVTIAREGTAVAISERGAERVMRTGQLVDRWVRERKVLYGVTTGFGALCDKTIPVEDTRRLQENILMSHAAGVGEPLPDEVVRAVMALRVHDLAMGHSAIRLETLRYLATFLNEGVAPIVPAKGSVGASGDLAPMAHLALVLIGRGEANFKGQRLPGSHVLERLGLAPLELASGEGLALINGTQVMTAIAALAVHDARALSKLTDIACALSLEVLMGSQSEFDARIHAVRPHPGQIATADNMRRLTAESELIASHHRSSYG